MWDPLCGRRSPQLPTVPYFHQLITDLPIEIVDQVLIVFVGEAALQVACMGGCEWGICLSHLILCLFLTYVAAIRGHCRSSFGHSACLSSDERMGMYVDLTVIS